MTPLSHLVFAAAIAVLHLVALMLFPAAKRVRHPSSACHVRAVADAVNLLPIQRGAYRWPSDEFMNSNGNLDNAKPVSLLGLLEGLVSFMGLAGGP